LEIITIIIIIAKGERGLVTEHVHSRLAVATSYLPQLQSIFSARSFVLAGHNNKKNNITFRAQQSQSPYRATASQEY